MLYHIRNIDGPEGAFQPYTFKAEPEMYTLEHIARGEHRMWRNGDFGPYALLVNAVVSALQPQRYGLDLSRMSLENTVLYHSAWIRFISDIYAAAGRHRTIGHKVLTLAIAPDGTIKDTLTNCN